LEHAFEGPAHPFYPIADEDGRKKTSGKRLKGCRTAGHLVEWMPLPVHNDKEGRMPQKQFGNVTVEVDADGFMTNQAQWTREVAAGIAKEEGIADLTPAHWKVIEFMQKEFKETGQAPTIRKLNKTGVVSTKELYGLFPGGPAKKAAKIAGLKKPEGCV
jgi:tRNA 2-thiouridine synthesizing protein E